MSTASSSPDAIGPREVWLTTQTLRGYPHLVPVWFVLDDAGAVWISTGASSAKVRNVRANPRVALGFPSDGNVSGDAVAHGTAEVLTSAPDSVLDRFEAKYTWRPNSEPDRETGLPVLLKITVDRWVMGSSKHLG
jgi:PPOX class probable F420-dependent enzyme